MEDEEIPFAPAEDVVSVLTYENQFKKVIKANRASPGDGALIGLKIILQVFDNPIIVNSTGSMTLAGDSVSSPFLHVKDAAAAASAMVSEKNNIICYAGDGATLENMESLIHAIERGDNFTYICYNNFGYSSLGKLWKEDKMFTKTLAKRASYVATASVSHLEDFVRKLEKCKEKKGVKFIDLLAPNPLTWGFETSNTIMVARYGVESRIWPLFEVDKKIHITSTPDNKEDIENFLNFLNLKYEPEQIENLKDNVDRRWRALQKGIIR